MGHVRDMVGCKGGGAHEWDAQGMEGGAREGYVRGVGPVRDCISGIWVRTVRYMRDGDGAHKGGT